MMKKLRFPVLVILVLTLALIATACKSASEGNETNEAGNKVESFNVWISKGEDIAYLPEYEDNPVLQYYLRDTVKGQDDGDVQLAFDFQVPAAGSEKDNFNTLLTTGDYVDIMATSFMTGSLEDLYKEGIILDITEYVETYMPNYTSFMAKHPEMSLATTNLVDGEKRYLALSTLSSSVNEFQGFLYRRDWIVKYGTHPETGEPFSGEYTIKKEDGTWNTDSWVDNVVFPSGESDPVYISDWEWMFEIFEKALAENNITDGYCMSIGTTGSSRQGYLDSSFGGGAATWYKTLDGDIEFGAATEEFKVYLQCVSTWYKNGWIDKAFLEHTSDMPWRIDEAKVRQGKVGLWRGTESQLYNRMNLGDELTSDVIVNAASLPINDIYGTDAQKFKDPYSVFQLSAVGTTFMFTDKLKDKDLVALFTFLDSLYEEENSVRNGYGLSKEEYEEIQTPYYEQWGLTDGAFYDSGLKDAEGRQILYSNPIITGNDVLTSTRAMYRFLCLNGNSPTRVVIDPNVTDGYIHQKAQWSKYPNIGLLPYQLSALLPSEDAKNYSKIDTNLTEFLGKNGWEFVKGEKDPFNDSDWETYLKALNKYNPQEAIDILTNLLNALEQ